MADENKQEEPDYSPPSAERQAELEAAYEKQKDTDAPYNHVWFNSKSEIEWVRVHRHWDPAEDFMNFSGAHFSGLNLQGVYFEGANLSRAEFAHTDLRLADFHAAFLVEADFQNADLRGADFQSANLSGADFRGARFSNESRFHSVTLSNGNMYFADISWGDVNLVVVDWDSVQVLGDETQANRAQKAICLTTGQSRKRDEILSRWKAAVRAYRLLATALRNQGMSEEADRFTYRARICQQQVFRYQRKRGRAFWFHFLDFIAGHSFKPERTVIAYASIIIVFAHIFWAVSVFWHTIPATQPVTWYEAIVLSFSSFHGRGFFPSGITTGDPLAVVAVFEAVFGLFIEISFIATFTQRYFGR